MEMAEPRELIGYISNCLLSVVKQSVERQLDLIHFSFHYRAKRTLTPVVTNLKANITARCWTSITKDMSYWLDVAHETIKRSYDKSQVTIVH